MRVEDVRRQLTTPLGAPAYPPGGPYRFTDREYLNITYRTDVEAMRAVVPEPLTVTDPDELMARLPAIAEQGYALDDGEQEIGVRCVAVPVPGGPLMTAISVSGPEGRIGMEIVPRVVALLERTATALAAELREDGPHLLSDRSS